MFTSAAARDEDLEEGNWGREAVSECFNGLSFFLYALGNYRGRYLDLHGRTHGGGRRAHYCTGG